jgi:K+-transporting ATPase KdpF subunit
MASTFLIYLAVGARMVRAVAGISYPPQFFTRFGLSARTAFTHHCGRTWRRYGPRNRDWRAVAGRPDVAPLQTDGLDGAARQMSVLNWIGLLLAVALGVYLVAALLFPEKFE